MGALVMVPLIVIGIVLIVLAIRESPSLPTLADPEPNPAVDGLYAPEVPE